MVGRSKRCNTISSLLYVKYDRIDAVMTNIEHIQYGNEDIGVCVLVNFILVNTTIF